MELLGRTLVALLNPNKSQVQYVPAKLRSTYNGAAGPLALAFRALDSRAFRFESKFQKGR